MPCSLPRYAWPPGRALSSRASVSTPWRAHRLAAAMPAGPAPTTATSHPSTDPPVIRTIPPGTPERRGLFGHRMRQTAPHFAMTATAHTLPKLDPRMPDEELAQRVGQGEEAAIR